MLISSLRYVLVAVGCCSSLSLCFICTCIGWERREKRKARNKRFNATQAEHARVVFLFFFDNAKKFLLLEFRVLTSQIFTNPSPRLTLIEVAQDTPIRSPRSPSETRVPAHMSDTVSDQYQDETMLLPKRCKWRSSVEVDWRLSQTAADDDRTTLACFLLHPPKHQISRIAYKEKWWSIDNRRHLVPVGAQRPTITMILRRQRVLPVASPMETKATPLKHPQWPTAVRKTQTMLPPHQWQNFSASKNLPAGHHPLWPEELPELSRWRHPF